MVFEASDSEHAGRTIQDRGCIGKCFGPEDQLAFHVLTMGVTLASGNKVGVDIADEASGQAHSLDGTS